jgi:hypothetical protein
MLLNRLSRSCVSLSDLDYKSGNLVNLINQRSKDSIGTAQLEKQIADTVMLPTDLMLPQLLTALLHFLSSSY